MDEYSVVNNYCGLKCTFILNHVSFVCLQISQEFKRITTVGLESTFLAKLDQCTSKLMALVQEKGGNAGQKIRKIKDMLLEVNNNY